MGWRDGKRMGWKDREMFIIGEGEGGIRRVVWFFGGDTLEVRI